MSSLRKGFLGSVLTLMSGNVLAQAVNIGCTPVITRLFSPEAYGEFALAFSAIAVLASISHLRYNAPVMLPRDDRDADALTLLALSSVAGFSLLLLLGLVLVPAELTARIGFASPLTPWLVPPGVLFTGIFLVLQIRNLREKGFARQATAQVVAAAGSRATVILAGLAGLAAPPVLVGMKLLNDFLLGAVLAGSAPLALLRRVFGTESRTRVRAVARRYADFPRYCGTDLVLMLNMELPTFLLALHFDPARVGLYNLAVRMLKQPGVVVGTAIGRSFFQHTAEKVGRGHAVDRFVLRVLEANLILYLFPAVVLWCFAPQLFGLVFGAEWAASGQYVRLLLPVFLLTFVSLFTGTLLDTLGLQRERFLFSVLQIAVTLGAFSLGGALHGLLADPHGPLPGRMAAFLEADPARSSLALLSAGSSLVLAARIVWVTGKAGVSTPRLLRRIAPPVLLSALLGAALLLPGARFGTAAQAGLAVLLLGIYFGVFYATRIRAMLAERKTPEPTEDNGEPHRGTGRDKHTGDPR